MLPRITLPPNNAALAGLAALFIVPGLANHDLWKTQDAIGLGVVHAMAASGDLLVPHIAAGPWLYDQPLYHWVALACAKLFGSFLQFHAAARLASGVFVAAALALIYLAARQWSEADLRRTSGCAALLMLLGCVGLLVHAHEALPELASLTAMCGSLAALPYATYRPLIAGAAFGGALGLAFLSATWIAPVSVAAAVLLAHVACAEWRTRRGAIFLGVALLAALVVAASWPLALALREPAAFTAWRAILFTREAPPSVNLRHFVATASWFTWPAWPLAAWSAWSLRARLLEPRLFVPGAAVLVMAFLFIAWGPPQNENLIPLLAPLVLFATFGIFTLRRGAAGALDWFGALTFAVFTGLVWLGYVAMMTGVPAPIARNFGRMAPGFVAYLHPFALVFSLLLAAAWLYLVCCTAPSPLRSLARWAGGIVLLWGTFATLWMPWVDYQKSYRTVALELRSKLLSNPRCIASRSLGVSQAAVLDYHGVHTQPYDALKPAACSLVLVQGTPQQERDAPPATSGRRWVKLADVGRPGDRAERYRLYRLER
ncbi:MAG: ArnT family glycosyltransferase [Burkholderiales bacterium]